MKAKKRKLYTHEKVLFILQMFVTVCSLVFMLLYTVDEHRWAHCAAWMCISVSQIASDCIRWEADTKLKKVGICFSSVMFVVFGVLLVLSL